MMKNTIAVLFFNLVFLFAHATYAQDKLFDLADSVVDFFSGEIPVASDQQPVKWVVAPVIIYAPETSWQFGLGSKILFKPRHVGVAERTSFISFSARITLHHQFTISPDYTIFSKKEKFIHRGEIAYTRFPRFYYGIGNHTPLENEEIFSFSTVSFEHVTYRNLTEKLYGGIGFRAARNFDMDFEEDGSLQQEKPIGIIPNQSLGLVFGLRMDNRNKAVGTTAGLLAEFKEQINWQVLGSDYNYAIGKLDVRKYWPLFSRKKDILAFQFYGYFSVGQVPFTELAALGGDMIMRGYYKGRYLDNFLLATQAEYRFGIWRNLGGVVFTGIGDVAHRLQNFNIPDLKPSAGAGLRYALLPEENLNIRLDFAVGKNTSNFYVNISEAF